jgi:hypothetical protein
MLGKQGVFNRILQKGTSTPFGGIVVTTQGDINILPRGVSYT